MTTASSLVVMFFVFMIVVAVAAFVLIVVYMGLRHAQNMKRIANGYPTLDGSLPFGRTVQSNSTDDEARLQ